MPRHQIHSWRKSEVQLTLVLDAATTVMEILKERGISCAIFGSLASWVYGSKRVPNDVGLLVLQDSAALDESGSPQPTLSIEELKALIVNARPGDFYLRALKDAEATFKILCFRPSPSATRPARTQEQIIRSLDPECKVDILVPGVLHLPQLRPERVQWLPLPSKGIKFTNASTYTAGVPLIPFALLLVQKLQAWDDSRKATEAHKIQHQHKDAIDVDKLLKLKKWISALMETGAIVWEDEELFSEELKELTRVRVKDYSEAFPTIGQQWKQLGFDVKL